MLYKLFPVIIVALCSCGGSNSAAPQSQSSPMSGIWNAQMTSSGASSPRYIFGLSLSGSDNLFNGTFVAPIGTGAGDSCMDSSSLTAQGNTSGSNFSMILTASNGTKISVMGTIFGATASGTYTTVYPASAIVPFVTTGTCGTDQGAFQMTRR